jgi:hypothetical protein
MREKLTEQEKGERLARRKRRLVNSGGYPRPMMPVMRKMARSIAHHNMETAGMIKVNKGYFAGNWRFWVRDKKHAKRAS